MGFNDKCAVAGVWNHPSASFLTYLSLYALQHRGQEGAGIVSLYKGDHISHKGQGLVSHVFHKDTLTRLKGQGAIGHTRYSTWGGRNELRNIQPFTKEKGPFAPLSVAHNGNIVNYPILKEQLLKAGFAMGRWDSDTACLFPLMDQLAGKTEEIESVLLSVLPRLEGAYSLVLLTKDSLIAVRDPMGFRPLVLGRLDKKLDRESDKKSDRRSNRESDKGSDSKNQEASSSWAIASETCALDLIEAEYVREILPGEILSLSKKGPRSFYLPKAAKKAFCIFEHVYFSRPDSLVFGQSVYARRKRMGELLGKEHPVKADMVLPVPDSGVPSALGYSKATGIPYEMGIIRNHYIGRTFITPSSSIRNFKLRVKLNPLRAVVSGKKIVAVDDSIVRGTTCKALVEILRSVGAAEVHLRISSPPVKGPCYYGVDTPQKNQLLAGREEDMEKIQKFVGADSLAYLSYQNLMELEGNGEAGEFCSACFSGKYPTPLYENTFKE